MNRVTTRLLRGPLSCFVLIYLLHTAQTFLRTSYRSLFKVPGNEKLGTEAWQRWGGGGGEAHRGTWGFSSFELLGTDKGDLISLRPSPSSSVIPRNGSGERAGFSDSPNALFGWLSCLLSFHSFQREVYIHFFIQLIQQKFNAQTVGLPWWMLLAGGGGQRWKTKHCLQECTINRRTSLLNGENKALHDPLKY